MRGLFTSTIAAVLFGAAIVSSQAQAPQGEQREPEPGGQKPVTQTPADGNNQPGKETQSAGQQSGDTTVTYRGYLRKSPTGRGYTITPIAERKGTGASASTPGAAGVAGTPVGTSGTPAVSYVIAGGDAMLDFATLANQCVDIVGTVAPTSGMQGGAGAAGNAGAAGGEVAAGVAAGGNAGPGAGAKGPETTTRQEGAQAGAGAPGNVGGEVGAGVAAGGNAGAARQQTLTVTTIRPADGTCTE